MSDAPVQASDLQMRKVIDQVTCPGCYICSVGPSGVERGPPASQAGARPVRGAMDKP